MTPEARTTVFDHDGDAADLYDALARLGPAVLLEDTGPGRPRRGALIGVDPSEIVTLLGKDVSVRSRDGETFAAADLFSVLRERLRLRFGSATSAPGVGGFSGGWMGYFGYDVRSVIYPSPIANSRDSALPDAWFGLFDTFVAVEGGRVTVTTIASKDAAGDRRRHERAVAAARAAPVNVAPVEVGTADVGTAPRAVRSNFTRERYLAAIEETKERIRAGDCYQLNLTQRFTVAVDEPPFSIYRRLRLRHGARYAAYFEIGGAAVLSASPECFLSVVGDRVLTRPIKGTIARAADPAADAEARRRLRASVKDRAELTMIVDLMRNDLNRVAIPGSVAVQDHATIESAPTVHHLVTGVAATIEGPHDVFDLLRAALPAGSITGCPKRRAMEIIDALETVRRGVYTGSIGRIGADGSAELSVAIRTIVVEDGFARVSGGGGITIDSDPSAEYVETIDKVKGILAVLQGEFRA